ncbi:hypothetical protein KBY66_01180 [Synechococcus sp. Tobar12-5m-g]|uniref:DUF6398 domain-containing protein n=1 Tax=unclassified Synechococcus TaxID=2626047 RepID=UPI0020CFA5F8|nr:MULTISPECIES: DUF6398 domain-containing protein [unclassified Synechococcus]MCP9771248.1 hypothetical protein [Synechococcus sp. Tobar12-5m-g]MCP9872188.1 hypothetical protein [Synechococcus sp. Cruz CV-v-12]
MAHSQRVPKPMQERFESLCEATEAFSDAHLNGEYQQLIRYLLAALSRKRPSPVAGGKVPTWAAAAVHAIGTANFLFERTQTPHCKSPEIFAFFGVSASNGQARSKRLRDLMGVDCFSPEWTLPSRMHANPMVWMVEVDGFIRDARRLPLQVQEIAYAKGLIPYIPALKESSSAAEHGPKTRPEEPEATAPAPDNGQLGLF